jgi:lipid A 3-O-deacylase
MNRCQIAAATLIAMLCLAAPATAEPGWGLSLGLTDVTRHHEALEGVVEHYFSEFSRLRLQPLAGAAVTADGAYYAFVGLRRPISIERWQLVPSFSVAGYEQGDGKNLGGTLEFRSGLDLMYELRAGARIGVGFYHLSNARIYKVNPGTNSLLIRLVLP